MEQELRLEQKKDRLELEARLRTAEDEARKSQEERVNLEADLKNLRKT
jgi:hypothetical protein